MVMSSQPCVPCDADHTHETKSSGSFRRRVITEHMLVPYSSEDTARIAYGNQRSDWAAWLTAGAAQCSTGAHLCATVPESLQRSSVRLAVLLAVVLMEGVFTIVLAQAAANGHQVTSLTSFDLMTVFAYIYPIVPAPVIFLALGTIQLGSTLLPRVFGWLAFGLGSAFEVVGVIALFTTPTLSVVVLSLQALWVLAAALTLLNANEKKGI